MSESKAKVQGNTLHLLREKLQLHSKGCEFREGLGIEAKNAISHSLPHPPSCMDDPASGFKCRDVSLQLFSVGALAQTKTLKKLPRRNL